MSTNFPASLDTTTELKNDFANTTAVVTVHPTSHNNLADSVIALETKVGITSSVVTTTHTYKLSGVTGSDKAASVAGTETLTAKTLTSPKIGTSILDTNGNELAKVTATGSAVNEVTLTNAATGGSASIKATGDDTNAGIILGGKGNKNIEIDPSDTTTGNTGSLGFRELAANGTNKTGWKAPDSLAADLMYVLPPVQGSASTFLQNDGSGNMTWAASAAPTCLTSIPLPTHSFTGTPRAPVSLATNTTGTVGQIIVPIGITVNKFSIEIGTVTLAGVLKIGLYSENGQTQIFTITTGTLSSSGTTQTFSVSSVAVPAGVYYVVIVPVSTASMEVYLWSTNTNQGLYSGITSKPVLEGTVSVSAGTLPSTVTPASITFVATSTLAFRLDN